MANSDGEKPDNFRAKLRRLKESTILSTAVKPSKIPENVINFMRSLTDDSDRDPDVNKAGNPYEFAKLKFNKIWAGRAAYEDDSALPDSPVTKLTTARSAMTAYWTSEKWKQAYMATGATLGLATLTAANAVWMAEAYAGVMDSVAQLANPNAENVSDMIFDSLKTLGTYGGVQIGSAWGIYRLRGYIEREGAHAIKSMFINAALENPDGIHRITHNKDEKSEAPDAMPSSPHETIGNAPTQMMQKLMNVAVGGWASIATSYFVGKAVLENSIPVEMLDDLGNKLIGIEPGPNGTAIAAGIVTAAFLAVTVPPAYKISRRLEKSFEALQEARGKLTGSLVNAFSNGESIAASKGNKAIAQDLNAENDAFRNVEAKQNNAYGKYIAFMNFQGFVGHNFVAFLPAISPLALGGKVLSDAPVKTIFQTHGLVSALLSSLSGVVEVLPSFGEMSAAANRISDLARHYDRARDKEAFYSLTGIHKFKQEIVPAADNEIALSISDFSLMHRGAEEPFLTMPDMDIGQGEWVHIKKPSGQGKSSFIKGLAGLWPYGTGTTAVHEHTTVYFAHQTADVSGDYSLAEHLLYGMDDDSHDNANEEDRSRMSGALKEAGLGDYADMLDVSSKGGKSWSSLLSGGQKQRLVLARILFQRPDIILLDEPTSDLDPVGKSEFFAKLHEHCGDATVLAITHDEHTPRDEYGESYFPKTLTINKGQGTLLDTAELSDDDTDEEGLLPPSGLIENDYSTQHVAPRL